MMSSLQAGASQVDVSPIDSQFLFGYPHVPRFSEGIHDSLMSSALCLSDGACTVLFVSNDVIFVDKELSERARKRIQATTGIPALHVMITATHTHSGPITVDYLSNRDDPIVPKRDALYLRRLEDGIVEAATSAARALEPAEIGLATADATGIGTNRRDPSGASDLSVPVFMVRRKGDGKPLACMLICSMHPTVIHENSRLVSADFPGMARKYLQRSVFGFECPVIHHTGPEGNQSPRHVTRSNTFEEAERIGTILGRAVEKVYRDIHYSDETLLRVEHAFVDLPKKRFPTSEAAQRKLVAVKQRFEMMKSTNAPAQETRTAECDWFGAEETVALSQAQETGEIDAYYASCLPAEVQVVQIGGWAVVGWPGEVFVEYGLEIKRRYPDTFIANLANGELQGYIVTEEAAQEGGYEASNAMFDAASGARLVSATAAILDSLLRG